MFCRHCGMQLDNQAVVCVRCGRTPHNGAYYCWYCGAQVNPIAQVCTNCGVSLVQTQGYTSDKSRLVAGLLGIFLGGLGIHNFYLGYTVKGIIQFVLTMFGYLFWFVFMAQNGIFFAGWFFWGIASLWGFIEGILILMGQINTDANGNRLKE